jgi:hypothetical protein
MAAAIRAVAAVVAEADIRKAAAVEAAVAPHPQRRLR